MKKVTASLVVYNPDIDRVIETLDSLFADTNEYKVIVCDNSLIKNNLEQELKKYPQVTYLWIGKNLGFGAGHNLALKNLEESEFHLFINPDITVKKGCTQTLLNFLIHNPDVGMVGPKTLNTDGTLQYNCRRNPTFMVLLIRRFFKKRSFEKYKFLRDYNAKYEMQDFNYQTTFMTDFLSGCFMMVRRKIFERLRGFDEDFFLYFEDADLTRRINQISKTCYVPEAVVIHDWMRGSHKNLKLALTMVKSAMIYFRKWGFRFWNY